MKKYLRLVCNVCDRQVDKLVDNTRVTPDRCTITLNCLGRLYPVEYRSDGQITASPEVGIVDWYPRGSSITSTAGIDPVELIDTSTGSLQQLVLALKLPSDPGPSSTAELTLEARSEVPKEFKQYTFRRDTTFSALSGVEDGAARKVLKFTAWGSNPDLVEVYLNGQKLEQGTGPDDFQVDDGTPSTPAPSNTIVFNTAISPDGTDQVDVIVSKLVPSPQTVLTFHRNQDDPNRLGLGAWENVSHLEVFDGTWQTHYLFTCDIASVSDLKKDSILYPVGTVNVDSAPVGLDAASFMLARRPYSKLDRYTDISVPLDTMGADRDYLKYSEVAGVLTLEVTKTSLQTYFPVAKVVKYNPENTLKTVSTGDAEQLTVDGKTVVGPDR